MTSNVSTHVMKVTFLLKSFLLFFFIYIVLHKLKQLVNLVIEILENTQRTGIVRILSHHSCQRNINDSLS